MKIFVTGAAGFIGYHLSNYLLGQGHFVVGIDNLNNYYPVKLKQDRLERLKSSPTFSFYQANIEEQDIIENIFKQENFDMVVNLAAQAGVRESSKTPRAYVQANVVGFLNILEACRYNRVKHLIFASSSSVYGANTNQPYSEKDCTERPISIYGATKKANELLAHSYANLFGLTCIGLRFFTVYGPWGRPDMALFKFMNSIMNNKEIELFNYGKMERAFTYIDDVIASISSIIDTLVSPESNRSKESYISCSNTVPYRIYNIGNTTSISLEELVFTIEKVVGKKANKKYSELQPGDMISSYADTSLLETDFGLKPKVPLITGIKHFVDWYLDYWQPNHKILLE